MSQSSVNYVPHSTAKYRICWFSIRMTKEVRACLLYKHALTFYIALLMYGISCPVEETTHALPLKENVIAFDNQYRALCLAP